MATKEEMLTFSTIIEELAIKLRCTRMDAILEHCKATGLEIEVASGLITPALKSVIREEAQELNMLKQTSKLPV